MRMQPGEETFTEEEEATLAGRDREMMEVPSDDPLGYSIAPSYPSLHVGWEST